MVGGGGTGDINTSAALVAASQGLSGSNDIGKNLGGFDAGDSRNAVPSGKAREAGEDSAKWVSPGQGPPAGDVRRIMQRVDSAPIDRDYEKTPTTTRSAGNRPYGGDKRPHTAHGGHGNEVCTIRSV